jgi:hypothetical protein
MDIKYFLKEYPGLFVITFLEGSIVMAVEIIGGNILTAHFGSSIYLWSGILGISLAGLAVGYFAGARFSLRPENKKLYALLSGIFFFTATIPFVADLILPLVLDLDIRAGVTIACLFILMPVMILCGMISPYIIQLVTKIPSEAGKAAGTVYSVSTAGGIIFTFLTGFLLIPVFGLRKSIFLMAGLFLIMALIYILMNRKKA